MTTRYKPFAFVNGRKVDSKGRFATFEEARQWSNRMQDIYGKTKEFMNGVVKQVTPLAWPGQAATI